MSGRGSTLGMRLVEAAWHLSQSGHPVSAEACREAHDEIERLGKCLSDGNAELAALKARIAERNKADPVWRLHNLCDAMDEDAKDSPYSEEAWKLQEDAYRQKCEELKAAGVYAIQVQEALRNVATRESARDGKPCWCDDEGRHEEWCLKARAALEAHPASGSVLTVEFPEEPTDAMLIAADKVLHGHYPHPVSPDWLQLIYHAMRRAWISSCSSQGEKK